MTSPAITAHQHHQGTADIAFVGGGPAALVAAIALARRGIRTTVFERDAHPLVAPRFNPDRSYTIDAAAAFPPIGQGVNAAMEVGPRYRRCRSFAGGAAGSRQTL